MHGWEVRRNQPLESSSYATIHVHNDIAVHVMIIAYKSKPHFFPQIDRIHAEDL